uniref:Uncharacterized protein n=1 Tax=Glossina palpalis gambiensis TaxID=67801 RepID=A0A1B0AZL6_9MUSC
MLTLESETRESESLKVFEFIRPPQIDSIDSACCSNVSLLRIFGLSYIGRIVIMCADLETLALVDTLRFDDEEVMDLWSIFLFFVICFLLMSCCGYCCTKKRRGAVLSEIIQY